MNFHFEARLSSEIAAFLLWCYNSSSCNGGRKLLSLLWLILRGFTGCGTSRNCVSLHCNLLLPIHLKGCLARRCFHKDLAGFPIQLSNILKRFGVNYFIHCTRERKQTCIHNKAFFQVLAHDINLQLIVSSIAYFQSSWEPNQT